MTEERLLTVAQVAERLQVSEWTVQHWLRNRRLEGFRLGGPKAGWRVPASAVDRFIAERMREHNEGSDGGE